MFGHRWKRWIALPNELASPMRPIAAAAVLAALLVLIFIVLLSGCEPAPPGTPQEAAKRAEEKQNSDRELEAWIISQKAVRKQLDFPLDAKFPWGADEVVRSAKANYFFVKSTVKAKNALGATLTYPWTTVVSFRKAGTVEVVALELNGQMLYGADRVEEVLVDMKEEKQQADEESTSSNEPPPAQEVPIAEAKPGAKDPAPTVAKKSQPADRESETEQPVEASNAEPKPTLRTWTDETGEYKVEAEFVSYTAGTVKLRKKEGQIVKLPIERLSEADQKWIRQRGRR